MSKIEGDIWLYHEFWPSGQFSRSNGGKTLFLKDNPYFWLRIWKEREISRQKWPVEKYFLWPWKGKKLRSNDWKKTRCLFSKLSWFFGVKKRSRCFTKVDEMLRCTSPWPTWPSGQFSRSSGGKALLLNENPYFWLWIWKKREISRQKWPVEKWFLWPWKGKKWRSNGWKTTRCPFSELSCFSRWTKSMKSWGVHHLEHHDLQVNFQGDLKVKTIFLRLTSVPGFLL